MNEIKFESLQDIVGARSLFDFPERLRGKNVQEVVIDSREASPGALYIPVQGERLDGHDFIKGAVENGASAVLSQKSLEAVGLTEEDLEKNGVLFLNVDSTLDALADLASHNRHLTDAKVIALTGSAGKTTTKDMIAAVLSQKFNTLKTQGNLNNIFGVPRTLLEIGPDTEAAVIEMGMDGEGEIAHSIEAVDPDVAIITNIGTAHMEKLGSKENILKAKAEIFNTLGRDNTALVNGDDEMLRRVNNSMFNVKRFGIDKNDVDILATDVVSGPEGVDFSCTGHRFHLNLPGKHNVYNALAAIWVGKHMGLTMNEIQEGFDAFIPSDHRMHLIQTDDGITVIDDSYNANPDSMSAALDALVDSAGDRRTVAVLGDMKELGDEELTAHLKLGREAARKVDYIIGVGDLSENMIRGAIQVKASVNGKYYKTTEDAVKDIRKVLKPGDMVLVKGSRGMHLENVVDAISGRDQQ